VLVGQIHDRLPTNRRVAALTFDAGADNAGAPKILSALARTGVHATFFMTGRWAELYPQWARRIAARYPIGNHTFDHTDLCASRYRALLPSFAWQRRRSRVPPGAPWSRCSASRTGRATPVRSRS
jgi:hypothetical protein